MQVKRSVSSTKQYYRCTNFGECNPLTEAHAQRIDIYSEDEMFEIVGYI